MFTYKLILVINYVINVSIFHIYINKFNVLIMYGLNEYIFSFLYIDFYFLYFLYY